MSGDFPHRLAIVLLHGGGGPLYPHNCSHKVTVIELTLSSPLLSLESILDQSLSLFSLNIDKIENKTIINRITYYDCV